MSLHGLDLELRAMAKTILPNNRGLTELSVTVEAFCILALRSPIQGLGTATTFRYETSSVYKVVKNASLTTDAINPLVLTYFS
ncbi:hypothetical protein RRG08_013025 [Elysia crispata]|uniref:Uncharacterized protein n=1 Tax=Elysia crispata TaxID=231223 RepID=A0AAE1DQ45_9GAST|nr:hypothetical protein RRG08_013025 [Elysia crispata]